MMASKQNHFLELPGTPSGVNHGVLWTALVLLLVAVATIGLRLHVPADALAPLVATLSFGFAAILAGAGLMMQQGKLKLGARQVAGILTFVGVGVSIAIEAEQITRLLAWSDQTE